MQNNNKTIAINTVIVYLRVVIVTIIGFITSRFILQLLGFECFGLYNVVGGIIGLFSFFSASLSISTQRFICIEQGKKNGDIKQIFNASIQVHLIFALFVLVLAELVGSIYIIFFLNIEQKYIDDAFFVFHISTLSASFAILTVPYQSILIAYEKFMALSLIDISVNIFKLFAILSLFFFDGDKLRVFSLIMCFVTILPFILYYLVCKKTYAETVHIEKVKDKHAIKELIVFNNYSLIRTMSLVLRSHGSVILVNYFFGIVANAAFAISNTVFSVVNSFVAQFDVATSPQITQSFSSGKIKRSINLTIMTCRSCLLLLALIYFPLAIELDYIIGLWLGEYPEGTILLCKFTLLLAVVSATSAGISKLVDAIGDIKSFSILYTILYVLCLPLGALFYKIGFQSYIIMVLFIVADLILRFLQLYIICKNIQLGFVYILNKSYGKCTLVYIINYLSLKLLLLAHLHPLVNIILCTIISIISIYVFGLYRSEKNKIINIIKTRI